MKLVGIFLFIVVALSSCGDSIKVAYAYNNQLFNGFELKIELTKKLEAKKVTSQLTLDSIKFELIELKKKIEITETPNEDLIKNHQLLYNEYLTKEKSFMSSNEQLAQQYDEQIMKRNFCCKLVRMHPESFWGHSGGYLRYERLTHKHDRRYTAGPQFEFCMTLHFGSFL